MFVTTTMKLGSWGMGLVLAVASVAAAGSDLRLVEAAKDHDTAAVRALLKAKVDVNAPQADGVTALHWAAHWNDAELATLLLRAGAHVNAANDLGVTPLALACGNGSAAMVDALLKAGAQANAAMPTGETVLMTCARTGSAEAVQRLLARGADVQAKETERGQTALMWAAAENHGDVVGALVAGGADLQARTRTNESSRDEAAGGGGGRYMRGRNDSAGYTPLLFAARKGAREAVRVLLDKGAKVNDVSGDGTTPLLVATHEGHWELAHDLLARGADPNLDGGAGFLALHWMSGTWESGISGADGAKRDDYWRLAAIGPGKLELVQDLLAHGANPNARVLKRSPSLSLGRMDVRGATPFLLAAHAGNAALMRALLAAGADPLLATTEKKTTVIMAAAGYGRNYPQTATPEAGALEAAQLALGTGSDINAANSEGETPLHAATYWGKDSMVQFLVDHGAKVNPVNKISQTPLSIANGVQQQGAQFYSWPNLQVLLKKLGGVVPAAEIDGPIGIMVGGLSCPQLRVALGDPKEYSGGLSPGYTNTVFSADKDTQYTNGTCTDLKVGVKVKVTGIRHLPDSGGDGSITAKQIEIDKAADASASAR